jgi:hypothetical protein
MNIKIKKIFKDFVSHIAKVISDRIYELQDGKYVSLMLDGSTDKGCIGN